MIGGFFNKYPYTDFHELNLDWILKTILSLQSDMKTFVNVNTIKYADPLQWNIASQYEQNTLVQDAMGMTYLSKQPVPAGISISNTDYWLKVADFDAYVEVLKKAITQYDEGSGTTATVSHQPGDLVWLSNELYQITAAMIPGDTYVPGSNCRIVTIAELLDNTGLFSNFEDAVTFENEGTSTTATAARAVGDVLWVQDVLYKVISPMIPGDTYVPGSNIDKVSIFELFANLLTLNDVNIGGDLQYKDPTAGTYYDTVEVKDTNGVPYNVMVENGNTGSLGAAGGQLQTGRPKIGWLSGSQLRCFATKFYMNGFRYCGQYYKKGLTEYHTEEAGIGSSADISTDIYNLDAPNYECWYGMFAIPDHDDVAKMALSPILRVTAIAGNTITVGATKERTLAQTLTASLVDLTDKELLLITCADHRIYGKVAKITAYTNDSITLDDTYDIGVNSYVMPAPVVGDDYCYVASHYLDTSEWRNRQDNGYMVKSRGTSDVQTVTSSSSNTPVEYVNYNHASPLATGVIINIESISLPATVTDVKYLTMYAGADTGHALTEWSVPKVTTPQPIAYTSPLIDILFDYRAVFCLVLYSSYASFQNINATLRVQGYYEP